MIKEYILVSQGLKWQCSGPHVVGISRKYLRRQTAKGEEMADGPIRECHVCCGQIIEAPCKQQRG